MRYFKSIPEYLDAIGMKDFPEVRDICIFNIEDYFGSEPLEVPPYRHDFFEITYGQGHDVDVKVGDKSFNAVGRLLSFSTPHTVSSWKINAFKEDSLGYMILFKPSILNNTYHTIDLYKKFQFFNLNSAPAISLTHDESAMLVNLMVSAHAEFESYLNQSKRNILSAYLTIILEKANLLFARPQAHILFNNRAEEIAFRFESLLKEKANYQLHLSDYAAELNISTNYLSESVKKATGKSAKTMAQEFLTLYAKSLLLQNRDTITVVSDQLGFFDTSNFVKFFKKRSGLTPAQFRKKNGRSTQY